MHMTSDCKHNEMGFVQNDIKKRLSETSKSIPGNLMIFIFKLEDDYMIHEFPLKKWSRFFFLWEKKPKEFSGCHRQVARFCEYEATAV